MADCVYYRYSSQPKFMINDECKTYIYIYIVLQIAIVNESLTIF